MAADTYDINEDALRYWSQTGYTDEQLDAYCRANDDQFMMAKIQFRPGQEPNVIISSRTWKLQEGHYGAIIRFFKQLALSEEGKKLEGNLLVHLEDGLFDYTRNITRAVPLLGFGRSVDDTFSFLIPDPAFLYSDGYCEEFAKIIECERNSTEPKINRIFWRGAASGTSFDDPNWKFNGRGNLVLKAREIGNQDIVDARLTKIDHLSEAQQELLREEGITDTYTDFYDFLKYRYLVDVDGYHCAWKSLFLKLASRSLVLKVHSNLEQWYYRKLKPWQHYVPLRSDSSDILMAYEWVENHPAECQKMITNANLLVDSITIQKETAYAAELCRKILSYRKDS